MAPGAYEVLRIGNLFRMGVLWTVAIILSYLKLPFQKVCRSTADVSFPRSAPEDTPVKGNVQRMQHVVASSGIGEATAEALALHGYHVILAGRSMSKLLEVQRELTKKHGSISMEALELNLCSLNSILSFKKTVETALQNSQPARQLQLLVNNAGILACSQRWTDDGLDSMMASNYLGPYFLTRQLLPMLHQSPHARIVNVSSFTHRCVGNLDIGEKQLAQGSMQSSWKGDWYRIAQIYETTKLCLVLFTYELHRRLSETTAFPKVSVLAADPGIVKTNIMRELPSWLEWFAHFVLRLVGLLQGPSTGANAVIDAALAPKGLSGKYFFGGNGRTLRSSFLSFDSDLGRQLWETSLRVCSARSSRD
ncbi:unnamed protein product [Calypogeia fissa]